MLLSLAVKVNHHRVGSKGMTRISIEAWEIGTGRNDLFSIEVLSSDQQQVRHLIDVAKEIVETYKKGQI
jgi:hypothetical protein